MEPSENLNKELTNDKHPLICHHSIEQEANSVTSYRYYHEAEQIAIWQSGAEDDSGNTSKKPAHLVD